MKGNIIIINGVSSSGKTTLAKALQKELGDSFYLISKDDFCNIIPFVGGDFFSYAQMILKIFHQTIKIISDSNRNVIVDTLFQESPEINGMLRECVFLLFEYPVLFVKTVCPLEELRLREKKRGDRNVGNAEKQLEYLVPKDIYDLTVDTYKDSMSQNIQLIKNKLSIIDECTSFKELVRNYAKQA